MSAKGLRANLKAVGGVTGAYAALIEFASRLWLVNFPTYILTTAPEVVTVITYIYSYVLVQNVGFCWAFLGNASFALACQAAAFLPSSTGSGTLRLVASFYVVYACARIVIYMGTWSARFAVFCLQQFSGVEKAFTLERDLFVRGCETMFSILIALESALLFSEVLCAGYIPYSDEVCLTIGLNYLTMDYPGVRRIVFGLLSAVVILIWQALLQQFPRWSKTMGDKSTAVRVVFQATIAGLSALTSIGAVGLLVHIPDALMPWYDRYMCALLFGWTIWLYMYTPSLIHSSGEAWLKAANASSLKRLCLCLCMTQCFFVIVFLFYRTFKVGFIDAQSEFIIACFCLPLFFISFSLVVVSLFQLNFLLAVIGAPSIAAFSVFMTRSAMMTGSGSVIVVFLHGFGKLLQIFGDDIHGGGYDPHDDYADTSLGHDATTTAPTPPTNTSSISSKTETDQVPHKPMLSQGVFGSPLRLFASKQKLSSVPEDISGSKSGNNPTSSSGHAHGRKRSHSASSTTSNSSNSAAHIAERELNERGQTHSSLVSMSLPASIKGHWVVDTCRSSVAMWGRIVRALAVTDSILAAALKAGIALAVTIASILAVISVLSVVQRNNGYSFNLLKYGKLSNGDIHFDHIISNVTLRKSPDGYVPSSSSLTRPVYASCGLSWSRGGDQDTYYAGTSTGNGASPTPSDGELKGFTLLDLALLSEVAYLDDDTPGFRASQEIMEDLFPGLQMEVITAPNSTTEGPKFMEVMSHSLNMTVIAVRGTDPGRLYDFLEDVALYSESVLYHLLTIVFPTMRLWSSTTTSRAIQWLYEANRFFGMQGEALYYRPLVQRIWDLEHQTNNTSSSAYNTANGGSSHQSARHSSNLILTGHSLGGGLARIVGTMTGVPSVSISPPGLALSFKKYNFLRESNDPEFSEKQIKVIDESDIHHESFAVISELDWITQVDHQVGMIQRIQCEKQDASHKNACHMLEGTVCHILKHCGDARGRFASCEFEYEMSAMMPWLRNFFNEYKVILIPVLLTVPVSITIGIIPDLL